MNRMTAESRFVCSHCGQFLQGGCDLAARAGHCPGCGQLRLVTDPLTDAPTVQRKGGFGLKQRAGRTTKVRHILYGAILGALALSVGSQCYRLLALVLLGPGSGGDGWAAVLLQVAGASFFGAFLSPWGLLGGVLGAMWASGSIEDSPPASTHPRHARRTRKRALSPRRRMASSCEAWPSSPGGWGCSSRRFSRPRK